MFETVTVDDALAKGRKMVFFPMLVVAIGSFIAVALLTMKFPGVSAWYIVPGLLLILIATWLSWSLTVNNWRLWAFENVRNRRELKTRAIKDGLIGRDNSFVSKTEIWSAKNRERWYQLQYDLYRSDMFSDDHTVPSETLVFNSKGRALFQIFMGVFMIAGGSLFLRQQKIVLMILVAGAGFAIAIKGYLDGINLKPQINISNKGLGIAGNTFYNWDEISNEMVTMLHVNNHAHTFLIYDCPDGERKIDILKLSISKAKLERLLRTYRARHENRTSRAVRSTVVW